MSIDPVHVAPIYGPSTASVEPACARTEAADAGVDATVNSKAKPSHLPEARQVEVNASFSQNNIIVYRILDKDTGDLILQIPPEQLLRIAESVRDEQRVDPPVQTLDIES